MKKIKYLAVLATFSTLLISATPAQPGDLGSVDLVIKTLKGTTEVDTPTSISGALVGNLQTVNLTSDIFAISVNNQLVSFEGSSYTFAIGTENMNINLYSGADANAVVVADPNGNVLGSYTEYNYDVISALNVPSAPIGYSLGSFKYNGNSITAETVIDKDAIIKYEYTANERSSLDLVTIKASGETTYSFVDFDTTATVTSTLANFSYWKVGEKIVSYNKSYTFTMFTDTIIREVVDLPVTPEPIINMYRNDLSVSGLNNITSAGYELPEGYQAVEAGILYGTNPQIGETGVTKAVARSINSNNEFAVRHVSSENKAAYLIYRDSDGNVGVTYGNNNMVEQFVFRKKDSTNGYLSSYNYKSMITNSQAYETTIKKGSTFSTQVFFSSSNGLEFGTNYQVSGFLYSFATSTIIKSTNIGISGATGSSFSVNSKNVIPFSSSTNEYTVDNLYSNELLIENSEDTTYLSYVEFIMVKDETKYDVSINVNGSNGSITSNVASALINEEVTLTVKPNTGFELETLTINNVNYFDIYDPATPNITLKMEKGGLNVNATFAATVVDENTPVAIFNFENAYTNTTVFTASTGKSFLTKCLSSTSGVSVSSVTTTNTTSGLSAYKQLGMLVGKSATGTAKMQFVLNTSTITQAVVTYIGYKTSSVLKVNSISCPKTSSYSSGTQNTFTADFNATNTITFLVSNTPGSFVSKIELY